MRNVFNTPSSITGHVASIWIMSGYIFRTENSEGFWRNSEGTISAIIAGFLTVRFDHHRILAWRVASTWIISFYLETSRRTKSEHCKNTMLEVNGLMANKICINSTRRYCFHVPKTEHRRINLDRAMCRWLIEVDDALQFSTDISAPACLLTKRPHKYKEVGSNAGIWFAYSRFQWNFHRNEKWISFKRALLFNRASIFVCQVDVFLFEYKNILKYNFSVK